VLKALAVVAEGRALAAIAFLIAIVTARSSNQCDPRLNGWR
jgi:hypothetical protein